MEELKVSPSKVAVVKLPVGELVDRLDKSNLEPSVIVQLAIKNCYNADGLVVVYDKEENKFVVIGCDGKYDKLTEPYEAPVGKYVVDIDREYIDNYVFKNGEYFTKDEVKILRMAYEVQDPVSKFLIKCVKEILTRRYI